MSWKYNEGDVILSVNTGFLYKVLLHERNNYLLGWLVGEGVGSEENYDKGYIEGNVKKN